MHEANIRQIEKWVANTPKSPAKQCSNDEFERCCAWTRSHRAELAVFRNNFDKFDALNIRL
jgi:hypothetical protein